MKKIIMLGVILSAALIISAGAAPKTITVVADEWEDCTTTSGSGLYFDIVREVFKMEGISIKTKIVPYERSKAMVQRGQADVVIGPYMGEAKSLKYPKYHIFVDDMSAVMLKSTPWKNENSLKNKNVVWLRGYGYNRYMRRSVASTVKITQVDDQKNAFKMLEAGRVLYYIGPSAVFDSELDKSKFKSEFIKWIKMYTCFQGNSNGKELSAIWDKNFKKLLNSGKIRQLFKKYNLNDFYKY